MPMVDDNTWRLHQRALAILNQLADNPDTGSQFKKMAMGVDKSLRFPDLDAAERATAPLTAKLTAAEERIAAMEAAREADKLAQQQEANVRLISADIDSAVKAYGLTDEGREKMTVRMKEKGSLDAEAAAAWVAAQQPKTGPSEGSAFTSPALNPWGSAEKDDSMEKLHTDPMRWQDEEVAAMLAENPLAA